MDQKQEKNMILHDDRPQNKNSTNLCPQNQNSKDILVGYYWEIRIATIHIFIWVYTYSMCLAPYIALNSRPFV